MPDSQLGDSSARRIPGSDGLEVYVNENLNVAIRSDYDTGGPIEMIIEVSPERIEQLIDMLRDCKVEALEARRSG